MYVVMRSKNALDVLYGLQGSFNCCVLTALGIAQWTISVIESPDSAMKHHFGHTPTP